MDLLNVTNCSNVIVSGLPINDIFTVLGLVIAVVALAVSRRGILPDVEFDYQIKELDDSYLTRQMSIDFFKSRKESYGNMYSHLTIFNGGEGKASDMDVAYNWDVSGNGCIGGLGIEGLPDNIHMIYNDYLFPGEKQIDVPAIDYESDVFEVSKRLLIRIRYKDVFGLKYCKCALFEKNNTDRGYIKLNNFNKSCYVWFFKKLCIKLLGGKICNFDDDVCKLELTDENKLRLKNRA